MKFRLSTDIKEYIKSKQLLDFDIAKLLFEKYGNIYKCITITPYKHHIQYKLQQWYKLIDNKWTKILIDELYYLIDTLNISITLSIERKKLIIYEFEQFAFDPDLLSHIEKQEKEAISPADIKWEFEMNHKMHNFEATLLENMKHESLSLIREC